jgi:hypothetical protein
MSKSRKNTQEMHESAPAFAGRPIRRLVRWDELQETRHLARAPDELDGLLDKDEHSWRYVSAQNKKSNSGGHFSSDWKASEEDSIHKTEYTTGTKCVQLQYEKDSGVIESTEDESQYPAARKNE